LADSEAALAVSRSAERQARLAIGSPIGLGALQFRVSPSIGPALYPEDGQSGLTLIARADAAMYRAKQLGTPFEFFDPPTDSTTAARP
jgi:GGDEF domain-containing protein